MILAAGLGKRLRPLTYVMPKPVAPVLNRPIVAWIADLLAGSGFRQVVTNVSYLPEQIREVLGDGSDFGLEVTYSDEPEPYTWDRWHITSGAAPGPEWPAWPRATLSTSRTAS